MKAFIASAKTFAKLALKNAKHWIVRNSPYILLAIGVICIVCAVVSSYQAYPKTKEEIAAANYDSLQVDMLFEPGSRDHAWMKFSKAVEHTGKMVSIWLPTALYIAGAGLAIFGGYYILSSRLAAATVMLASTTEAFNEYRNRVKEAIGSDAEEQIYSGLKNETIISGVDENGEPVADKVYVKDGTKTLYGFMWGPYNEDGSQNLSWTADMAFNKRLLENIQSNANVYHAAHNVTTLNDLREWFGCGWTDGRKGQLAGWSMDKAEQGLSDSHIILKTYECSDEDGNVGFWIEPNCSDITDYLYTREQ